jgi:hypothetical protein
MKALLTALVVNVKRMVKLLSLQEPDVAETPTVRAELGVV